MNRIAKSEDRNAEIRRPNGNRAGLARIEIDDHSDPRLRISAFGFLSDFGFRISVFQL